MLTIKHLIVLILTYFNCLFFTRVSCSTVTKLPLDYFVQLCLQYESKLNSFLYTVELSNDGCSSNCILFSSLVNNFFDSTQLINVSADDGVNCDLGDGDRTGVCLNGQCFSQVDESSSYTSRGSLYLFRFTAHIPASVFKRNGSKGNFYLIVSLNGQLVHQSYVIRDSHHATFDDINLAQVDVNNSISFTLMDHQHHSHADEIIYQINLLVRVMITLNNPVVYKFTGGWITFSFHWINNH